jgi:hypothetical protein
MSGTRPIHRSKSLKAFLAAVLLVPLGIVGFATPSGAQGETTTTTIPPDANFTLAGITRSGSPLTTGAVIDGQFAFCKNANGLGSELYFEGSGTNNITIKHASVSPMVIPLHFGVISITDSLNTNPIQDDFVTIGVVEGTPADFGSVGPSNATYGGVAVAPSGGGMVSFSHDDAASDCTESRAMPILEPIWQGNTSTAAPTSTTTTAALTSTTTTAAPTTTTTTT